jgi:hypothetical protein
MHLKKQCNLQRKKILSQRQLRGRTSLSKHYQLLHMHRSPDQIRKISLFDQFSNHHSVIQFPPTSQRKHLAPRISRLLTPRNDGYGGIASARGYNMQAGVRSNRQRTPKPMALFIFSSCNLPRSLLLGKQSPDTTAALESRSTRSHS